MTETVGFVGIGLMGHGIAKNIMEGGYPMHVIAHRNRGPLEDLVSKGAVEVTSLSEMAKKCSVTYICAPGSPQIEAIVEEMAPSMNEGTIIVDCSTADPTSTLKLSDMLGARGMSIVDAPLGGTPVQAEAGELATMVGASDADFVRLEPMLKCWAGNIVHLGGVGDGHKMKLLNNMLAMGYAAMYSEALAVANKVGITTEKFDSVIRGSRMDNGFYQTFMGYAVEGNREAHKFTLTNALKDMRYLASMADNAGVANPMGGAIKNSFAMAHAAGGDGLEDYVPHLVDYVAKANGLP
jgi:3-hydroxyisobutyrate dehydrogenase-like beta-hydroxyacid dehydrogenase